MSDRQLISITINGTDYPYNTRLLGGGGAYAINKYSDVTTEHASTRVPELQSGKEIRTLDLVGLMLKKAGIGFELVP